MEQQSFQHKEHRYLIPPMFIDAVKHELKSLTAIKQSYDVITYYLDYPAPTWSALNMGEQLPKIRFRVYDGKDSFLEKKLHTGSSTTKERVRMEQTPEGLLVVGATAYTRTEYVLKNGRVTVDRDLRWTADEHGVIDRAQDAFPFLIVEAKGDAPKTLLALRGFEDKKFSKFKLLSGRWKEQTHDTLYTN